MTRSYRDHLADILICFLETQEFTRGFDFDAFVRDKKTINAVVRSLEVMGEAAKRIPEEIRGEISRDPVEADDRHARQAYSPIFRRRSGNCLGSD